MRKSQVFLLALLAFLLLIIDQYSLKLLKLEKWTRLNPRTKYVLYWTEMFHQADFNLGFGRKIFENCSVNNCFATNNRSVMSVEDFDAILFHGVEFSPLFHGVPTKRSPHQVYVYSNQEAPTNSPKLTVPKNFFNWTMTYRSDSDVIRPYGFFEASTTDYYPPSMGEIKNKRKKIAWLVSNCIASSLREDLYRKISKFVQVDVYGACGNLTCSKKDADGCYKFLEKHYKFYLSFENSLCKDYVTEKLFNILKYNLVPIVYGDADYEVIAPPHSVINVLEYKSIKELAKHIRKLDEDAAEYLRYFEWKKTYAVSTSNKLSLCQLCEKLNEPVAQKVYSDVDEWWRTPKICKTGNSLPKISPN
ncbi:alpha-(1,3)-fucosyltransferase C [Leptinotarsa decemlineata]|uniref:alpha-(1,3)-fucosyltransferase C n=1 Tax=Leptinotarsa decemlineata TaxID=7539 RepID=UPI003D30B572